jgi:hypothetical protein
MQATENGRALPTVIVVGNVSRGSSELVNNHAFNLTPQQLARVHCYYPEDHPHLMKTPVPTAKNTSSFKAVFWNCSTTNVLSASMTSPLDHSYGSDLRSRSLDLEADLMGYDNTALLRV